jgi:3-hydroxyethyl bacteriochlorophyllide a dehydrogenase
MDTQAIVFEGPETLAVRPLALTDMGPGDLVVDVAWSGISTGTERLLWTGRMPPFPGMGYPLVPGYESVGRVRAAGPEAETAEGDWVFVPGANCYSDARGLFGGAAATLIVPEKRVARIDASLRENAVLLALAATARHAIVGGAAPDLIVGHGVLGRLLARVSMALGNAAPTVWETNAERRAGGLGYAAIHPDDDDRRDYRSIYDVSGDSSLVDALIARMSPGGELVLAGFYEGSLSFDFVPAFLREARMRVAAEWRPDDLTAVRDLAESGALRLDGLISHRSDVANARDAYGLAFEDPSCLKMILNWSTPQ